MELDIKGHSGCSIRIINCNGDLFIEKSTNDINYFNRLIKQAKKQINAEKLCIQEFCVPQVKQVIEKQNSVSIIMDYVYSQNYIEYFENSNLENLNHFTNALIAYIDSEINNCTFQLIETRIIIDKINSINDTCKKNNFLNTNVEVLKIIDDTCFKIIKNCNNIKLPIGNCHGDLTFSNILFSGRKYYLIDFLDSFIESPLIDIVKIRQDTAYGWSNLMYLKSFDKIRFDIITKKIDSAIDSYYSKHEWYNNYYLLFQLINFLRIIQYANDLNVINYLKEIIKKISFEYESNSSISR